MEDYHYIQVAEGDGLAFLFASGLALILLAA